MVYFAYMKSIEGPYSFPEHPKKTKAPRTKKELAVRGLKTAGKAALLTTALSLPYKTTDANLSSRLGDIPAEAKAPAARAPEKKHAHADAHVFMRAHTARLNALPTPTTDTAHLAEMPLPPLPPLAIPETEYEPSDTSASTSTITSAPETLTDSVEKAAPVSDTVAEEKNREDTVSLAAPETMTETDTSVSDTPAFESAADTLSSSPAAEPKNDSALSSSSPARKSERIDTLATGAARPAPAGVTRARVSVPKIGRITAPAKERFHGKETNIFIDPVVISIQDKNERELSDRLFQKATKGIEKYSAEGKLVQSFPAKTFLAMSTSEILARYPKFTHLTKLHKRMQGLSGNDQNGGPGDLTVEQYVRREEAEEAMRKTRHKQTLAPNSQYRKKDSSHENDKARLIEEIDTLYREKPEPRDTLSHTSAPEARPERNQAFLYSYRQKENDRQGKTVSYSYPLPAEKPAEPLEKKKTGLWGKLKSGFSKFFSR